jgi:DNA-binding LacI/PurR family transcriptional regulator
VQDEAKDTLNYQRGRAKKRRIDSHGEESLRVLPNAALPTRERVLQAAAGLSYSVDSSTSRLAPGRTMTLGSTMLLADQWFYSKVSTAAEASLNGHGYDIVQHSRASLVGQAELFKWQSPGKHVDGLTCFTVVGAVHTAACGAL